jgi:hypothetical protein
MPDNFQLPQLFNSTSGAMLTGNGITKYASEEERVGNRKPPS